VVAESSGNEDELDQDADVIDLTGDMSQTTIHKALDYDSEMDWAIDDGEEFLGLSDADVAGEESDGALGDDLDSCLDSIGILLSLMLILTVMACLRKRRPFTDTEMTMMINTQVLSNSQTCSTVSTQTIHLNLPSVKVIYNYLGLQAFRNEKRTRGFARCSIKLTLSADPRVSLDTRQSS